MRQLTGFVAGLFTAHNSVIAQNTWCFSQPLNTHVSQIKDIEYNIPERIPRDVAHELESKSLITIGESIDGVREYYIRAGIFAPAGLSQRQVYSIARRGTITFKFYYDDFGHNLLDQSMAFYDTPAVLYNLVLRIRTSRQIERVYVQCTGGI
jgi:hypothetical protein